MSYILNTILEEVQSLNDEQWIQLHDDIVVQNWDFFRNITFSPVTDCLLDNTSIAKLFFLLKEKDEKYAYYIYSGLRESIISFSFLIEHVNERLHTYDPPEEIMIMINAICTTIRNFSQEVLYDLENEIIYRYKLQRTIEYIKREIRKLSTYIDHAAAEYEELYTSNLTDYQKLKSSVAQANSFLSSYGIHITIIGIIVFDLSSMTELDQTWEHEILKLCVGLCYFKNESIEETLTLVATYLSSLAFYSLVSVLKLFIGIQFRSMIDVIGNTSFTKVLENLQSIIYIYYNGFIREMYNTVCSIQQVVPIDYLFIMEHIVEYQSYEEFIASCFRHFSDLLICDHVGVDRFLAIIQLTIGPGLRNIFHKFAESFATAQGIVWDDSLLMNESSLIYGFNEKSFSLVEFENLNSVTSTNYFHLGNKEDILTVPMKIVTSQSYIINEMITNVTRMSFPFETFYKYIMNEYKGIYNQPIIIEQLYNHVIGNSFELDPLQEYKILLMIWYISVWMLWIISMKV